MGEMTWMSSTIRASSALVSAVDCMMRIDPIRKMTRRAATRPVRELVVVTSDLPGHDTHLSSWRAYSGRQTAQTGLLSL